MMKNIRHIITSVFLLLLTGMQIHAQEGLTITGKVTDESNQPLAGAYVMETGSGSNGALTDMEGNYSITLKGKGDLQFSFLSYRTLTVKVAGRASINVKMEPEHTQLETAVAIGYGTAKKADLTGAVSVVDVSAAQASPLQDVGQMLQGRIAGADILSGSGELGESASIQIRGARSITAGNEPLIIVDGVMDAVSSLSDLNPSDIVSISVLKDVSSTAIYGSRGANGVILVTTDSPKQKDTKIDVIIKSVTGFSHIAGTLDIMNASEYATWWNMIKLIEPFQAGNPAPDINPWNPGPGYPFENPAAEGKGTDWIKLLSQTGLYNDQYAMIKGRHGNTTVSASLGYNWTKGIVLGSDYKRYTGRVNVDSKISRILTLGVKASYIYFDVKRTGAKVTGTDTSAAVYLNPLLNKDSTFNRYGLLESDGQIFDNPYQRAKHVTNIADKWILGIHPYITLNFRKGFTLKSTFSFTHENHFTDRYSPSYMPVAQASESGAFASRAYDDYQRYRNETTLQWKRSFKRHNIDAVAGFSASSNKNTTSVYYGTGFIDDDVKFEDMAGIFNSANYLMGTGKSVRNTMSAFGRIGYNYDRRYYLTLTARADGASNFSASHKWGFFPAAAFRWTIKNEDFLLHATWLNDLSLRLSAGRSGNDAISAYKSLNLVNTGRGSWVFGHQYNLTSYPQQIANRELTWETTDSFNLGLNFEAFRSRLKIEADLYWSRTSDLLLTVKQSQVIGYDKYLDNFGNTENYGVEVTISSDNIRRKNFVWSTDLIISHNTQTVTDSGAGDEVVPTYTKGTQYLYGYRTGYPVNSLWGYKYGGVWHNQAELDRNRYTNMYVSTIKDGANGSNLGRAKYYDINGDGNLDENDVVYLGNTDPVVYGGFQNDFTLFGKFNISTFFSYSLGGKMYNLQEFQLGSSGAYYNKYRYMLNAWHPTRNPDSDIPMPKWSDGIISDRFIHDASFLRLKTVSVSYTLNLARWSKTFKTLKMGLTGENLFLLKYYNGFDPDVSTSSTVRRLDSGSFPRPRTYTVNLQLNF